LCHWQPGEDSGALSMIAKAFILHRVLNSS
jgi:hypothetical protein